VIHGNEEKDEENQGQEDEGRPKGQRIREGIETQGNVLVEPAKQISYRVKPNFT
jgi:hypothetical protein